MEMTNRWWVGAAALSCATLAALRLPPTLPPSGFTGITAARHSNEVVVAGLLSRRIADLHEGVSVLARRDTLLAASRANPTRTSPLIVTTARLTAEERASIEQATTSQAAVIGQGARDLILGVVIDSSDGTPSRQNYRTDRRFLLPAATDGHSCATVMRLGRGRRELDLQSLQGLFGPCAYYAAFGPPGPAVEGWLRKRGYDVAGDGSLPATNPALLVVRKPTREEEMMRWLDFSRPFRLLDISGCSSGDEEFCAKSMRKPTRTLEHLVPDAILPEREISWRYSPTLGEATSSFLSDLHAVHGRAQFEKFWKSSGDLEVAFKAAFGESTGQWTMRWMQYHYGRDNRGPMVSSRSALLSALASVGLVLGCAAVAHHRDVT